MDGTCTVCERTRAVSPCFKNRGKILVGKVNEPGEVGAYVSWRVSARKGSTLGNPFKITDQEQSGPSMALYETWLRGKIVVDTYDAEHSPESAEARKIKKIKAKKAA